MRRYLVVAAALVGVLSFAGAAAAKGPDSASISGPGLSHSLKVRGDGEGPTSLGALADASGFFPQMYGQSPDPVLKRRPAARLGAVYAIVYTVPGPNRIRSTVVQHVYPYATPVPLSYMTPGQSYWGDRRTLGGWFRASRGLTRVLVRVGVPATPPTGNASFLGPGAFGTVAAVATLLLVAGAARTARRRGWLTVHRSS